MALCACGDPYAAARRQTAEKLKPMKEAMIAAADEGCDTMKKAYLVERISGGGWDTESLGVFDNCSAAVFACIQEMDDKKDDHTKFRGITNQGSGSIMIWSKWGGEYAVIPIAVNKIEE
jgi:hypothetical protein